MKINCIKKSGKKYILELDDGSALKIYGDLLIKYNILYHKEISYKEVELLEKENIYYDAYNCSLSYISKKIRSKYEVYNYLDKFLINDKEKNEIIDKLVNLKLIDDRYYANAYINDSLAFTLKGPYKIKKELLKLKIDDSLIDDALSNINDSIYYDNVKKIINKKLKMNKKYSGYVFKQKLVNELMLLGYPDYVIYESINSIDYKGDIINEYKKIYNKLSKKYSGSELDLKIKQKLYSLGYTNSDIEKVTQ